MHFPNKLLKGGGLGALALVALGVGLTPGVSSGQAFIDVPDGGFFRLFNGDSVLVDTSIYSDGIFGGALVDIRIDKGATLIIEDGDSAIDIYSGNLVIDGNVFAINAFEAVELEGYFGQQGKVTINGSIIAEHTLEGLALNTYFETGVTHTVVVNGEIRTTRWFDDGEYYIGIGWRAADDSTLNLTVNGSVTAPTFGVAAGYYTDGSLNRAVNIYVGPNGEIRSTGHMEYTCGCGLIYEPIDTAIFVIAENITIGIDGLVQSGLGDAITLSRAMFPSFTDPETVRNATITVGPTGRILAPAGRAAIQVETLDEYFYFPFENATMNVDLTNQGYIRGDVNLYEDGLNSATLYSGSQIVGNLNLGVNPLTSLVLTGTGYQLFSEALTGDLVMPNGKLVKAGSGSWDLDRDLTFAGGTTIENGTLLVNANLPGDVLVQPLGALGGGGYVLGNVRNLGTVSPGNSPGTLTINGDFTQAPSGSLITELASKSIHDRLEILGNANLNGTAAFVSVNGFIPRPQDEIQFIKVSGSTVGKFSNVLTFGIPNNLAGVKPNFLLEYRPDGIFATIEARPLTDLAVTPAEIQFAKILEAIRYDADGDLGGILDEILFYSEGLYRHALREIGPEEYSVLGLLSFEQLTALHDRVGNQLAQRYRAGGSSQTEEVPANEVEAMNQAMFAPKLDRYLWVGATGSLLELGLPDYGADFEGDRTGASGGFDWYRTPRASVGLVASVSEGAVDFDDNGIDLTGGHVGVYASRQGDRGYLQGLLGLGATTYDVSRGISFGSIDRTAEGSATAFESAASLEAGRIFAAGGFHFNASLGAKIALANRDGFQETGAGALNLAIEEDTYTSLEPFVGLRISRLIALGQAALTPEFRAGYDYELLDDEYEVRGGLANGFGSGFHVSGGDYSRHGARLGFGLDARWAVNFATFLGYDVRFDTEDLLEQQFNLGVRFQF